MTTMEAPATAGSANSPTRLARTLLVVQVVLSALALAPPSSRHLLRACALVPYEAVVRLQGWRLFTGHLFDTNVLPALLNVVACALAARPAELSLGRRALSVHLAIGTAISGVLFSLSALFLYILFRVGAVHVIYKPVASFSGINLILLIVLKHHIPDHEVGIAAVRMPLNYAPVTYVAILACATLLGQLQPACLVMALLSAQFSWMYMRYLRSDPTTAVRGDPSDNFSYASFFPPQMHPPINAVANIAFAACIRPVLGADSFTNTKQQQQQNSNIVANTMTQDRASTIDAERRRQRAQKSLDERMAGSASEPAI